MHRYCYYVLYNNIFQELNQGALLINPLCFFFITRPDVTLFNTIRNKIDAEILTTLEPHDHTASQSQSQLHSLTTSQPYSLTTSQLTTSWLYSFTDSQIESFFERMRQLYCTWWAFCSLFWSWIYPDYTTITCANSGLGILQLSWKSTKKNSNSCSEPLRCCIIIF